MVRHVNNKWPQAEVAKPIYLYPTETTNVKVKVNIDEFTETIPDHGKMDGLLKQVRWKYL
jgi:hypothetical protein